MQELGPRFTLKLRSLQKGTFDSKYGDYIWTHNVSASYYNTIHAVVVIKELSFFCRENKWIQVEENFTCKKKHFHTTLYIRKQFELVNVVIVILFLDLTWVIISESIKTCHTTFCSS